MIGPTSSSSFSSSSSSQSTTSTSAKPAREYVNLSAMIANPTQSNLNNPALKKWICTIFLSDGVNNNQVKSEFIANVQKAGTERDLNQIFGELRANGLRPYFPSTDMGTIDSAHYNEHIDQLVWYIHNGESEFDTSEGPTIFEAHHYELDSDTNKWVPASFVMDDSSAKERKYKTGS